MSNCRCIRSHPFLTLYNCMCSFQDAIQSNGFIMMSAWCQYLHSQHTMLYGIISHLFVPDKIGCWHAGTGMHFVIVLTMCVCISTNLQRFLEFCKLFSCILSNPRFLSWVNRIPPSKLRSINFWSSFISVAEDDSYVCLLRDICIFHRNLLDPCAPFSSNVISCNLLVYSS